MRRHLVLGLLLAAAGCQLPPDQQEALRPLRDNGPVLTYDQLATRARRQADIALELSYEDRWGDVQDAAAALEQTAKLLPRGSQAPELKPETQAAIAELSKDASRLKNAAGEVAALAGMDKEKKVREINTLLISINKGVRSLRLPD